MRQITAIILAAIMVSGAITPVINVDAKILQQFNDGVPVEELFCTNPSHVLVTRNIGKVACVFEGTAEKKGWEIIKNKILLVEYDFPLTAKITETTTIQNSEPIEVPYIKTELQISNLPKLGESAEIIVSVYDNLSQTTTYADDLEEWLYIRISNNFEVITGLEDFTILHYEELDFTGYKKLVSVQKDQIVEKFKITVVAFRAGEASITAGEWPSVSSFDLVIGENETLLKDDYYKKYPSALAEKESSIQAAKQLIIEEEKLEEEKLLAKGCQFVEQIGMWCPPTDEELEAMKLNNTDSGTIGDTGRYIISNLILPSTSQDGVPVEELFCTNPSHVLVTRNIGKVACVFEETAEKTGWEIIDISTLTIKKTTTQNPDPNTQTVTKVLKTDITKISKQLTKTNIGKISDMTFELGSNLMFWPQYTLTFPEQVRIGEKFDVVMDYQFIIPATDDDENGVEVVVWDEEPEGVCSKEYCGNMKIWIGQYSNIDLINRPDYIFDNKGTDTEFKPNISTKVGYVKPIFNNTTPQQETFTFVINKPTIDYNLGEIIVGYYPTDDTTIHFYTSPNGVVYLSKNPITSESVNVDSTIPDGVSANTLSNIELVNVTLVEDYSFITPKNSSEIPHEDPPLSEIPILAAFFKENYPDANIEEELKSANFTQNWIDKFFEQNPELRVQSYIPSLHWILPQAYGASPNLSYIYGNLKYYDSSNNLVPLSNIKVCAFDI